MKNNTKKYYNLILITFIVLFGNFGNSQNQGESKANNEKTIFAYGGQVKRTFIKYVAELTKKPNPKICFIPTAAADSEYYINYWYSNCVGLSMEPYVLKTFINASPEQQTFEETILGMDAIIVGGGNTLNMLAIWKAQGIDLALKKAYEKGIVLAGGSAGSLCWFQNGYTDSRPKELSYVECLGFLKFSHCPHYHSEKSRKPIFEKAMLDGKMTSTAYACDDLSGLVFINGELKKSVAINNNNNNYILKVENGIVKEELIPSEIIK